MSRRMRSWKRLWPLSRIRDWRDAQIMAFYRRQGFLPIDETKAQDIFICGYPKSGNTWVQNLLASLVFGLDPPYLTDRLVQEVVPDIHQAKFYKRFFEPCFFKTHHEIRAKYQRVIHLIRDPRDVVASFYHFDVAQGKSVDLDAKVEYVIDSWSRHSLGYLRQKDRIPMMTLRYEDLLQQPEAEIKQILDFLKITRTNELCARAVEGNCFSEIRKREEIYGLANAKWPAGKRFFRKGAAGSFKDTLSERQIKLIDSKLSNVMREFSYYPCTSS